MGPLPAHDRYAGDRGYLRPDPAAQACRRADAQVASPRASRYTLRSIRSAHRRLVPAHLRTQQSQPWHGTTRRLPVRALALGCGETEVCARDVECWHNVRKLSSFRFLAKLARPAIVQRNFTIG